MKLCFITREAPPNLMGGIGTYVANITELLVAKGHEVILLTAWSPEAPGKGLDQAFVNEAGVQVYYLPFVVDNWAVDPDLTGPEVAGLAQLDVSSVFAWAVADALERLVPKHGIEYIEAPEYEAPLSIFLNRRSLLPPDDPLQAVPCAVHLHSPSHLIFANNDDDTSSAWIQQRKRFELESIRRADAVLAPSQYLARQVAAELDLPGERFTVIPYPLGKPLPQWDFSDERPDGFHCLYVGRVEPRKGVFEWVEAASEIVRQYPETYFHFVGGPHVRETREAHGRSTAEIIQSFIPADLKSNFFFHAHMPREELGRHYYQADCCAVPSRWDNYPNTCMEAMRCGKLVLASNQGGMAEMIEHEQSGLVAECPYGDRRALKEALKATLIEAIELTPESRQAIGQAAKARIETICDNDHILKSLAEWRKDLRARQIDKQTEKISEETSGRLNIGIFLTSTSQPDAVNATLESVAALDSTRTHPVLIHNLQTDPKRLPEFARSWDSLPGNPQAAHHPTGYGKDVFHRLLGRSNGSDLWCFLTPGMRLRPDFAKAACCALQNCPSAGFSLPWIHSVERSGVIARAAVDAGELLLHPSPADLFSIFRQSALAGILSEDLNGYYLSDILRDMMLKMKESGYPGLVLPKVLAEAHHPLDPCCLSNFCLHHPADSHFQLLEAHKSKLDLDLFIHHHTSQTSKTITETGKKAAPEADSGSTACDSVKAKFPHNLLRFFSKS
ncbi:MAG: glycosyltransferase [Verrucomicrobia bacterium]|jgi:glycosyltransferase involved in cell wall biosynthesis|nr:glycosyltransferase [Verrucomicrobiota bacterium]